MKKLITLLTLAVFVLSMTAVALADTGTFAFSLEPPVEQFTETVKKADSEQNFYVTVTKHNLKDGDSFWFGPRYGSTAMSAGLRFDNKKALAQVAPYTKKAYAGYYYKLRGNSRTNDITSGSMYTITVDGRWTP